MEPSSQAELSGHIKTTRAKIERVIELIIHTGIQVIFHSDSYHGHLVISHLR